MIVCLWAANWPEEEREQLLERLLVEVPRLALGPDLIWADARGLDAPAVAQRLRERATSNWECVGAGVARSPIVAQLAARSARTDLPQCIGEDAEQSFLAPLPLAELALPESLRLLLQGVGIETCGQLASLDREAVEVRFGSDLLVYWQRSRAQDDRFLFTTIPPEQPHAALDFIDYEVTDPERLIFSVNSLLGGLCEELRQRGQHARSLNLKLKLADGQSWERVLRPARATGSRTVWLRLARALLERITVSAAVTGIVLVVAGTEAARAVQGDLFDAGFATASAVDAALARLSEAQGDVLTDLDATRHSLVEQRSRWKATAMPAAERASVPGHLKNPGLTLQLLPEPRQVLVETVRRRDHQVPVRFRDGQWQQLLTTAGPDRISGGRWDEAYAREYFRAVTVAGVLVWLYRDARTDLWYLHGWWD
jgi:protein ImuB